MDTRQLLEKLMENQDLSSDEATWMMSKFMEGEATSAQMSAILVALRLKNETVTEITACARVMREKSTKISVSHDVLLDTCGTGGDASGSINISTTVALLLAGGGYKIAKHGNRSMTSKSGSADLLEALDVNINLTSEQVEQCIDQVGIGFLFAPALHSAMKNVVPVRRELGIRTIFNVLGPLTNPAGANTQIIGLYTPDLVAKIVRVLKELGTKSAYVVSGLNGLDEVCISGDTQAAFLNSQGEIKEFIFNPVDYGFKKADPERIKGGTPSENAEITRNILKGELKGPMRDIIVLNAGFAVAAADDCSLEEGFAKGRRLLDDGSGMQAIEKLRRISNSFS